MRKGRTHATAKAGDNGHHRGELRRGSPLSCSALGARMLGLEMFWLFRQKRLLGQERQFIELPRLDRTVPWGHQLWFYIHQETFWTVMFFGVNLQSQARFFSSCKLIKPHSNLHIRIGVKEGIIMSQLFGARKKLNRVKLRTGLKCQKVQSC